MENGDLKTLLETAPDILLICMARNNMEMYIVQKKSYSTIMKKEIVSRGFTLKHLGLSAIQIINNRNPPWNTITRWITR